MFRRVAPNPGYCLFFPNRTAGQRFVAGRSTRAWWWEEWKHIKLGLFEVLLPAAGESLLLSTADRCGCQVKADFRLVVGGTGSIEEIESRMSRLTPTIPPTRDIRWRVDFDFFRPWAANYCVSSLKRAIEKCQADSLEEPASRQEILDNACQDLAAGLDRIGLILAQRTISVTVDRASSAVTTDSVIEKEPQKQSQEPRAVSSRNPEPEIPSQSGDSEMLRVFLCHATDDKALVRELHHRLKADAMAPWLDEEDIMPGQDWDHEIKKAVHGCDVVLVCLSRRSIGKRGYVQKEISYALDIAKEQPEGVIYIVPVRLEDCRVPDRLRHLQWVDLFDANGYDRLARALQAHSGAAMESRRSAT